MGQKLGASVSAGGAQAQKAVEGVGAQGEASASKIEKAFGHIRWEHLLGAFALIRSGMAAMEFDFSTAAAHGEMADAILADNALGVLKAQKDIAESDRKFLASLPVIGAALSHLWDNDIKGMDDAMKKEEGMQKALEKDAEMVKKWDYEVALNKAKMTGSKAEEQRVEAAFKGEEEQEKVAALEERVRDALNAQVDAQQKLGQSRMTGAEQVADLLASGAKGGSSLARTILLCDRRGVYW